MSIIRIQHGQNSYYFEHYKSDTINDIMKFLNTKYNFDDEEKIEIYQGPNKLDPNQKISDLKHKDGLYINGIIKSKKLFSDDHQENNENVEVDYLAQFHEMGFIDCDEKINQLLQENYKFEDIIIILIKNQKTKKSKKK